MTKDVDSSRLLRVFLCHSSGDKSAIRELYKRLEKSGYKPWLDEEDILPGEDWSVKIPQAVRNSDVVLVCLSCESINKDGYVQKEIKFALDIADEKIENSIFLIPVKLEECDLPQRLSRWQCVDLIGEKGYERLIKSLNHRASQIGIEEPVSPIKTSESIPQSSDISRTANSINNADAQTSLTALPGYLTPAVPRQTLKVFNKVMRAVKSPSMLFSSDLGIDVGTSETIICAKGRGIVLCEPSIVAFNTVTNRVVHIGKDAEEAIRTPPKNVVIIRPIQNNVIVNPDMAKLMLRHFMLKARAGRAWGAPRVVTTAYSGMTLAELQNLKNTFLDARASKVYIVDKVICTALGMGPEMTGHYGNMIVDLGSSTTNVAVIIDGRIVHSRAIHVAGDELNEGIIHYLKRKYNLLIGERTAEAIKMELGSAWVREEAIQMEIKGRNLIEGVPRTITINDEEVREALADVISIIVNAVRLVMDRTSPELLGDLVDRGIVLTGAGALLDGIDKRFMHELGMLIRIAENPIYCLFQGLEKIVSDPQMLKKFELIQPTSSYT